MDTQIFETAAKYGGVAGIALVVLLRILRSVLKLPIFKEITPKGTFLTITLIIKSISLITIVALLCWMTVAIFGHAFDHQRSETAGPRVPPPSAAAAPANLVVTNLSYQMKDMPSGACADYSGWYKLCSDNEQPDWVIVADHFTLSGNRSCTSGWAECKKTIDTAAKVCYEFRMQGQNQECGHSGNTGIHYSTGDLSVSWQHPK